MSKPRIPPGSGKFLLAACAVVTATVLAQAAELVKPNIRPGLWEVTTNPQISGMPPIPEDRLARMTPEQRAKVQAMMQAAMANAAKPRVFRECMTPEKLSRGFNTGEQKDPSCVQTVIASTSSALQIHQECNKPDRKSAFDVNFQILGGEQMMGTVNMVMTTGTHTMSMKSSMQGKWLGASCGDVKDFEMQK